MKRLTVIWGIILVLIVALLTTLGIIFNKKNKVYTCDNIKVAKKFKDYESAINYLKNTPEKDKFQIRLMIKNKRS